MPLYNIKTVERWDQEVEYCDVEADDLEEAWQMIYDGDVSYSDHELIEDGAWPVCIWSAKVDDEDVEIPLHLTKEQPEYDRAVNLLRKGLVELLANLADVGDDCWAVDPVRVALAAFDKAHPHYANVAQIEECPTPDQETSPE